MKKFQLKSFLTALLIALLLYWNFYLVKMFLSNTQDSGKFQQATVQLGNVSNNLNKITEGLSLEEALQKQDLLKEAILKNFRVQYGNGEIIAFFAQLTSSYKLSESRPQIVAVKPYLTSDEAAQKSNAWEYVEVKFDFKARYHEAAKIVNLLEKSAYLIEINRFSLARSNQDVKGPLQNTITCRFLRIAL